MRIVIADDNIYIRDTLRDIFMEEGYKNIDLVSDGLQLLAYLKTHSPEVIILDLMMPERDGLEVFYPIKTLHPQAKIIIYTAFDRYRNSHYAQEADKFFLKNVSPQELISAVKEIMEKP